MYKFIIPVCSILLFSGLACKTKESTETKDVIIGENGRHTIFFDATASKYRDSKTPKIFWVYTCKNLTHGLRDAFKAGETPRPLEIVYGPQLNPGEETRFAKFMKKYKALQDAKCTRFLDFTAEELKKYIDIMTQERRKRLVGHYNWKVLNFKRAIERFEELLGNREKLLDEMQGESVFLREIINVVREEWESRRVELDLLARDPKYKNDEVKVMRDRTKEYQLLGWTFWTSKWEEAEYISRAEYTREGITKMYADLLTSLKNANKSLSGYEGSPEDLTTLLGAVDKAKRSIKSAKTSLSLALRQLENFKVCYAGMTKNQDDVFWKIMSADYNFFLKNQSTGVAIFSGAAGVCPGFINRELKVASITDYAYARTPAISYNPLLVPINSINRQPSIGSGSSMGSPNSYSYNMGGRTISSMHRSNEPQMTEFMKAVSGYLGANNYWSYFFSFYMEKLKTSRSRP